MTDYKARVFADTPVWDEVETAVLEYSLWEGENPYSPRTTARLCAVSGKGIFARLVSCEPEFRAVCTKRDDPVYTDSCMELFFRPFEDDDRYLNFEINPLCCCLSAIGTDRNARTFLREITDTAFTVSPLEVDGGWGVELFIPERLICEAYGKSFAVSNNFCIYANVYKCAELAKRPHYQALFFVGTEQPDFHRPEFFGLIKFEL